MLPLVAALSLISVRADCLPDGTQQSGALYRICLPSGQWNGDLVLWAHGYVAPNQPLAIPDSQLPTPAGDTFSISQLVTQFGYAFATSSYSVNGLAIPQGVADLADLMNIFTQTIGYPNRVFLIGGSEGGLVAALSIEKHPELYTGALAACGPVGDFQKQINYVGDFRVIWDYFFPGSIPGAPFSIPQEVMDDWDSKYVPQITITGLSRPTAVLQLLNVTKAPVEFTLAGLTQTIGGLLWYDVFGSNDAALKLGGQAYDNSDRSYTGSLDDATLNATVPRFIADTTALATLISGFTTSGILTRPLVTIHTTGDTIVPYWHEDLYSAKVAASGSDSMETSIRIERYGHCEFQAAEAVAAFSILLQKTTGAPLANPEQILPDDASLASYQTLMQQYVQPNP